MWATSPCALAARNRRSGSSLCVSSSVVELGGIGRECLRLLQVALVVAVVGGAREHAVDDLRGDRQIGFGGRPLLGLRRCRPGA